MFFGGHTLSVVTDLNMVANEINNIDFTFVISLDVNGGQANNPNIYNMPILVPPMELLAAWADGVPFIMQNQYPNYLMSKDQDETIVSILAALVKKNVIIYIPKDDFNIYGTMLLNHIYYTYGIIMNSPTTTFMFDESKIAIILSKFYLLDLMVADDFLKSYPSNYKLIGDVINKLAMEVHPFNYPASYNQYAEYFNNLILNNRGEQISMMRKTV